MCPGTPSPARKCAAAAVSSTRRALDLGRRTFCASLASASLLARGNRLAGSPQVPILVFHRFAPSAVDSMTLRTSHFEAQMRQLDELSCQVIPLSDWVAWRLERSRGREATLPPRAVVLTADDGHRSQFEVMAPLLRARHWPVTLFVYPSAISNASYALSWSQLRELVATPGFSVQSHSYWHPNLLQERARMAPDAYRHFATEQLSRSRATLEQRLGKPVTLLAWPFGLSDSELATQAGNAGYEAAFCLGNRSATAGDSLYAVPRHLMVDSIDHHEFARRLQAAFAGTHPG